MAFLVALFVQLAGSIEPAMAALDAGRYAEARGMLERIVEQAPREPRAWAALARAYHGLALADRAADAARRAEPLIEASPEAQHTLALYYAQTGNRKRAAELECLYAASPRADAAAPARAAMLSAEVGHWPQAVEFGRIALDRGQRPDLIVPMLARAYEAAGRFEDAVEMRRRIVQSSPANEEAQAGYGIALLRAARFREAAEHLERARRSFDKSAQIDLALGTAYYAQRRFEDACARFLRVIELDSTVHQPYIFLARMIDQVPARAAEFLAQAKSWHESGSKHAFAPYVHAKALAATGASDGAVKPLLEEAIRRDASQWEFHYELGQLHERARDFAATARAYEKSVACQPQRPEPHYRLARVYDRLGKPDDARKQREIHAELMKKEQPAAGMEP